MHFLVFLAALFLAAPMAALDLEDTEFRVEWTASSGSPDGYNVFVSRDGGEFAKDSEVTATTAVVGGELGESLVVRVQAFRGGYVSESSEDSEAVRLVSNAPGAIEIKCVDPAEALEQVSPGRFRCVPEVTP